MSEVAGSSQEKTSKGINGIAMVAPILGLPVCMHAVCGAIIAAPGVLAALTPLAVPAAIPALKSLSGNEDVKKLVNKILPTQQQLANSEASIGTPVVEKKTVNESSLIDADK
ncbi:hypothetical protein [Prosthecochloris vibrioformis]|uniref:Uncharacterized protein n=1 Tax=Prosthecochloris vibrioformis TaxID=1098 RepID=A0A5C4S3H3_PROVB|nr:hypothetical protein [Prosthecochloris vibrioformis]TNJ38033.1 hypothetical protein FGF68_02310 [Prosthecochloris vibrioformis]